MCSNVLYRIKEHVYLSKTPAATPFPSFVLGSLCFRCPVLPPGAEAEKRRGRTAASLGRKESGGGHKKCRFLPGFPALFVGCCSVRRESIFRPTLYPQGGGWREAFFVLPLPQALGALFSEGLRAEGGGRRQKTGRKCGERREAPKNYLGHQVHASLSLAVCTRYSDQHSFFFSFFGGGASHGLRKGIMRVPDFLFSPYKVGFSY